MADNGMNYEQALDILQRMHKAAPPVAASKLAGVIDLLERMKSASASESEQPPEAPPPSDNGQRKRNKDTMSAPRTPSSPPPLSNPIAPLPSQARTQEMERQHPVEVPRLPPNPPPTTDRADDSQDSRSFSRLLGRLLKSNTPARPTPTQPPPPVSGTVDYVFQDFDLAQYDIDNMPDPSDSRITIDEGGSGIPGTGELFSDLPDFAADGAFDPNAFSVDAVLGLPKSPSSGDEASPTAKPPQTTNLMSVLGLTGSLDPQTFDEATSDPAPDLFRDIPADSRRSTGAQRAAPPTPFPENVGMEDVSGLLKDADLVDSKASGEWHVTDVLNDLGVERPNNSAPAENPPNQPEIDAAFDLNSLYANFLDENGEPDAGTSDEFNAADAFPGTEGWGTTGVLSDTDADDSPSQFGATSILADAPADPLIWGKTEILGDDPPVPSAENAWGMTTELPEQELPADPDEMPSARLWGATAQFADDALLDELHETDELPDEMPSARLWDAHAPLAEPTDEPESDSWFAHAPTLHDQLMRDLYPDDGLTELESPQDAWMVENGLVDSADSLFEPNANDPSKAETDKLSAEYGDEPGDIDGTVNETRARWSEPPTWLVDEPLASDPTRYHQSPANDTHSGERPRKAKSSDTNRLDDAAWNEAYQPSKERRSGETNRLDDAAWNEAYQPSKERRSGETNRLDDAAWNANYQPQDEEASSLYNLFDGGVSEDGGLVPDEYAIYDANVLVGHEALENLVAFAVGESPSQIGGDAPPDLPGPAALLTNVREVLKPSLLLLRAQTELLRDRVDETLDENDSQMVRLMQDNAESALTLLESLEMIMQLSEGSIEMASDVFSSIDLLREAGERMQDRARTYKHRITVHLDRGLPKLRADYRRTLAILVDIMENAVRYTPEGGSSRITVDNLGGYVLFTVADNGIGLTEQEMYFIGQPFWRALHQPLVRVHRGTGLRLYLARRVLEMQGGELFFSGESGKGSTFSFTVPVAQSL